MSKNVLIMGAGPAGAMTACILAAVNSEAKITVLDNRAETRRNYGLSFAKDSIESVQNILRKSLQQDKKTAIEDLMHVLDSWKGKVRSTVEIETILAQKARMLGVTILRKDEYKQLLTTDGVQELLAPSLEADQMSADKKELYGFFREADIIIGAEGAHSILRQTFVQGGDKEKRVEVQNLQYFIEVKYQTAQQTKALMTSMKVHSCEGISFETMNNKEDGRSGRNKPATIHFFVGKTTYDHFASATNESPWDLTRLQEEALQDPIVENQALKIAHYFSAVIGRGGCCVDARIKRLPITIYRSPQAVVMQEKKVIVLVGDALSGAVFARGVNKAFIEASYLAETVNNFFNRNVQVIASHIPEEFNHYEEKVFKVFDNEKWWATFKASGLKIGRTIFRSIIQPLRWISTPLRWVYSWIKSFFVKEPSLGELLLQLEGRTQD